MIKIVLAFIITINIGMANHLPSEKSSYFGVSTKFTLIKKVKSLNLTSLLSYQIKPEHFENLLNKLTIGAYYRLFKNIKIGLFYQRQYGVMHDEDWIDDGNDWFWRKTSKRGEDLIVIDLSPKYRIQSFVVELKVRYIYNYFNKHKSFKIRPGLIYFWFKEGVPFLNLFARYEMYLPQNYSKVTIYEKWLYFGGLYHINNKFKLSLSYAKKNATWSEYPAYNIIEPGVTYRHKLNEDAILLNFIWHL